MKKRDEIIRIGIAALILAALAVSVFATVSVQTGNINLTSWSTSDLAVVYDDVRTIIYANYTNISSGPITDANCTFLFGNELYNMSYNSTERVYKFDIYSLEHAYPAGNHTYNVSCNKTGYPWLNTTDNLTITNRNPVVNITFPVMVIEEDSLNDTIDLRRYFYDPDVISKHTANLEWNFTSIQNITITIDNMTGILNITPDTNFYGAGNTTITAIDPLNGTNSTNLTIIVTNTPEVSLANPADGSSGFNAASQIVFSSQVADDYDITQCSLYLNNTLNQTVNNPPVGNLGEAGNDTGTPNTPGKFIPTSTNLTKQINLTNTNYTSLKVYLTDYGGVSDIVVYFNGNQLLNISKSEVTGSWITKQINQSYLSSGINNISFNDPNSNYPTNYYELANDSNNEYLVRFANDLVFFNSTSLPKGDWTWNASCTNNQSQTKTTGSWNLTVQNSAPSTPTAVLPSSGSFNDTINISCSGSTDDDLDSITYFVSYNKESSGTTWVDVFNSTSGNYTWNVSSVPGMNLKLGCYANDGASNSGRYDQSAWGITIYHTGSPSNPTALTCNNGDCNNSAFGDEINISCSGANDTDSNFSYFITAYYDSGNNLSWKTIAEINASLGYYGDGNYTWNTTLVMNQTGVKIDCYANDSTNAVSYYNGTAADNMTISHANAPTMPSNLAAQLNSVHDMINVSCNGSTGQGTIRYELYAYYSELLSGAKSWHAVNLTLAESDVYGWNISGIPEQSIDFECRAFNGYYSQFYNPAGELAVAKAPSAPEELLPANSTLHEYEMDYSCSGSKNIESFAYTIDMYYNNGASTAWHTLDNNFPGAGIVNDSRLVYEDGVFYSVVNEYTPRDVYISLNATAEKYYACVKAKGTGVGSRFKIWWNCTGASCTGEGDYYSLTNNLQEFCQNVTIDTSGLNTFKINANGQISSTGDRYSAYFDQFYLKSVPSTFNVTAVSPQKANLSCYASDSFGSSASIYTSDVVIDRVPIFNTSKTLSYDDGTLTTLPTNYKIRLKAGTNALNIFNISEYFYDLDNDALSFSAAGNSSITIDINQTTGNVSIYPGSWTGTQIVRFTANDGLATGYSQNITIEVYTVSSGGGSKDTGGDTTVIIPPTVVINPPTTPTGGGEEKPPVVEQPAEIGGGGKSSNTTVIESSVIKNVFNTKIKHTRTYYLSRSKTRIAEKIENIGFYDLEDIVVRITVPKNIAQSASEITKVDDFQVIEEDPVIGFVIPIIEFGSEIELSYIINERLLRAEVEQIGIDIVPRELSPEEIAEKQRQVQEQITNTSRYVNVTTTHVSDFDKQQTSFKIDLNIEEGAILYDVSVFAEIPKCLVEILKEEMIDSDIDFEIINEDPLIRWHFDEISKKEEINYLVKTVADENCTNQMNVMPLAKNIMLIASKANLKNALIPLLIIPIIIFMITFFSAYGFEEEEKIKSLNRTIKWARASYRQGYSWTAIKESLKSTRRYSEGRMDDIIRFSSNLPKLLFTKMDIGIEESIVVFLIALDILDFLKVLPGELEFAKLIISWTILGYLLFKASITHILFGTKSKMIDLALLAGYFMLVMKNFTKMAETGFAEAGYVKDLYVIVANNAYIFDSLLFMLGISVIILTSVYIASRLPLSRKSFMGALGEYGMPQQSVAKTLSRAVLVFLAEVFFFIVVFNLMMEWLAIAVDASLITAAVVFYFFVLIKHRDKHWVLKTLSSIGSFGEKFYENFVELFHSRKTIFIGLTGMLMLHTVTEIGIFIIPYVLGIYNPLYYSSWQAGHSPIFNVYGWLQNVIGIKTAEIGSLFSQGSLGMGIYFSAVLFAVYALNIVAIIFLLSIQALVWYHLYQHRKQPVSEVHKLIFSRATIALFVSSATAFIMTGAFRIEGLYFRGLMGVDILTSNIAQNPNLDIILGISVAVGLLAYSVMALAPKTRNILNWIMIAGSFVFFFKYIALFFMSVVTFYASTISTLTYKNIFISIILLVFMTMTIIFYGLGVLALAFELWLRNELGLRSIIRVKELPEWMKHYDMSYIHHESMHIEKKHGAKFEMLKNYILEEMKRGHRFSTVLIHILETGWSESSVEEALHELRKNKEFIRILAMQKQRSADSIAKLASLIETRLRSGMLLSRIVKDSVKSGWGDYDIMDALLIIDLSKPRT